MVFSVPPVFEVHPNTYDDLPDLPSQHKALRVHNGSIEDAYR